MALTGQLSDMSLAELIEFFCNQRKTGRLKIDYPRGHSVFFIKEGELVDAKVGALSGPEAVYFSLTLPNAAFDFSPDVQATRRTIDNAWTQVVLEGLRRLDEGLSPTEADAFGAWSPSETEFAQMLNQVEHLDSAEQQQSPREKRAAAARANAPGKTHDESAAKASAAGETQESSPEPFSMMVEGASSGGGSKKKFVVAGVAAAVVLACAVAAFPLLNRPAARPAPEAATTPAQAAPAEAAPAEAAPAEASGTGTEATTAEPDAAAVAADATRREERERRERERRERERREDAAAKKEDAANALTDPAAAAVKPPAPAAPAGPKSVRVSVSYDEAGRVTQAAVAGATPGAEAYGSTAVRIARGKRFPAGKAGSTVITIPVN
jgi:hypothetical protein